MAINLDGFLESRVLTSLGYKGVTDGFLTRITFSAPSGTDPIDVLETQVQRGGFGYLPSEQALVPIIKSYRTALKQADPVPAATIPEDEVFSQYPAARKSVPVSSIHGRAATNLAGVYLDLQELAIRASGGRSELTLAHIAKAWPVLKGYERDAIDSSIVPKFLKEPNRVAFKLTQVAVSRSGLEISLRPEVSKVDTYRLSEGGSRTQRTISVSYQILVKAPSDCVVVVKGDGRTQVYTRKEQFNDRYWLSDNKGGQSYLVTMFRRDPMTGLPVLVDSIKFTTPTRSRTEEVRA